MRALLSNRPKAIQVVSQVALAALFAVVGLLIFAQIRSARSLQVARQESSTTDRAALMSGLVDSNLELQEEVRALQSQLDDLQLQGGSLTVMVDELNRLKLVNGGLEVTGPGITVTLSGALSATELQDFANELRNAGAQAISLNGRRLIVRSAVVSTGTDIMVDGVVISRPYIFMAFGDAETMRVAITRRGGMLTSLQVAHPGFEAEVNETSKLTIPIYSRKLEFKYAQVAEESK
jgi:uncharacterized protein YlxW (UPF0749 family)